MMKTKHGVEMVKFESMNLLREEKEVRKRKKKYGRGEKEVCCFFFSKSHKDVEGKGEVFRRR